MSKTANLTVKTQEAEDILPVPAWMAGIAVGVQSLLWSLTLVLVPSVATYVAFADTPEFAEASWWSAAVLGLKIWVVTHGGAIASGTGLFTLIPLGLLGMVVFFTRIIMRRSGQATWPCLGSALGIHFAGVLLLAIFVGEISAGSFLRMLLVTALAVGGGLLWGARRLPDWHQTIRPVSEQWQRLPIQFRRGVRFGIGLILASVLVSLIVGIWWLKSGWPNIAGLFSGLITDPISAVTLVITQLIFLPNVFLWAIPWLAGPGFQVGSDSLVSTADVTAGVLPPMPVLAVVPDSSLSGELFILAPLLTVLVGTIFGLIMSYRLRLADWSIIAWRILGAVVTHAIAIGIVVGLASGSAGPAPLDAFGTGGTAIAWTVSWQLLIGMAIALLAWSLPQVRIVRQIVRRDGDHNAADPGQPSPTATETERNSADNIKP